MWILSILAISRSNQSWVNVTGITQTNTNKNINILYVHSKYSSYFSFQPVLS